MRLAAAVLLLLGTPALADGIRGTCGFRFSATSTLHDFAGAGTCRPFSAPLLRDAEGKSVLAMVDVEVPVAEMSTGNDKRDREMRTMFQSDRHPAIRASARDVDTGALRGRAAADPEGKAPLQITLTIRGVERTIDATVNHLETEGGRVACDIAFPVSLKEFDLKPPSVLGIIRVGDRVDVTARITFDLVQEP